MIFLAFDVVQGHKPPAFSALKMRGKIFNLWIHKKAYIRTSTRELSKQNTNMTIWKFGMNFLSQGKLNRRTWKD